MNGMTKFEVQIICDAYESGYGKGLKNCNLGNPYIFESPGWFAYEYGYEEGLARFNGGCKQFFKNLREG